MKHLLNIKHDSGGQALPGAEQRTDYFSAWVVYLSPT